MVVVSKETTVTLYTGIYILKYFFYFHCTGTSLGYHYEVLYEHVHVQVHVRCF